MFEKTLNSLSSPILVDAVYYALRLIKHRYNISNTKLGYIIQGLDSEPSPEAQQIALQILDELEKAEGKSVRNINKDEVERYIAQLVEEVQNCCRQSPEYSSKRAEQFLQEFRQAVNE